MARVLLTKAQVGALNAINPHLLHYYSFGSSRPERDQLCCSLSVKV